MAAATAAVTEGDPGAHTPVSFQYLIDELDQGWYIGSTLLRSLQDILTVRAGRSAVLAAAAAHPLPAPYTIDVGGRAGGRDAGGGRTIVPRGRRRNDCDREVIPNPCPIQRLHILSGENMRGMCQDVALPTL